jgi:hypothetical protein
LGRAFKYGTETVEDMTNVASEFGSTISVSQAKYMTNRKKREITQTKLEEVYGKIKM